MSASATVGPVHTIAAGLLVFLPMLVEARLAARHERALLARGGVEPQGDVYRLMQFAYPGAFLAMLTEQLVRGDGVSTRFFASGVALFVAGKALKWWAILSLGPFWTFRVIVVPSTHPVRSGPYRFFSHPNYLGVIGELVGGALMTASPIAGPLGIALFGALMLRRVAVENRARDAILRRS